VEQRSPVVRVAGRFGFGGAAVGARVREYCRVAALGGWGLAVAEHEHGPVFGRDRGAQQPLDLRATELSASEGPFPRIKELSAYELTVDASGQVVITGSSTPAASIDGRALAGGQFVAGFDAEGRVRFVQQAPCPASFALGPGAVLFGYCNDARSQERLHGITVILTRYAP